MKESNHIFEFTEEWSQVFGGCNWYTITPIHIEFEYDKCTGGMELTAVLLGIGFRWRWNFTETEMTREIAEQVAEIKREYDI